MYIFLLNNDSNKRKDKHGGTELPESIITIIVPPGSSKEAEADSCMQSSCRTVCMMELGKEEEEMERNLGQMSKN